MAKKLGMLLATVVAIAFAVPVVAAATTPTLFDHAGKVEVEAKTLETSTNFTITTSLGTLKCEKVTVTGKITHNNFGTVRSQTASAGAGTNCEVGGNIVPVGDITFAEVHTAKSSSGTINVTAIKATLPGDITCTWSSSGITFTYTAGVTNDTLQITNGNLAGVPAACEPGIWNATFTLETDASPFAPVWIQ